MDEGLLWAIMMQRIGGWSAIAGAGLLIAAGLGFAGVTLGHEPEAVLQQLSNYPIWYWPAVNSAFVAGAFLWIVTFMGLTSSFRDMRARVLGHVGIVSLVLGAAMYAVNSFVSGTALTALAQQWAAAPLAQRSDVVQSADTLLTVLGGTWIGVLILFHGVSFVLIGAAVAYDSPHLGLSRWIGVIAGVGSMLTGALMLATASAVPPALSFLFAAVGALWMVGVGIVLKRRPEAAKRTHEALQVA